jgi:KUP system potassium uptake protein
VRALDPPPHRPRKAGVFLNAGKETTPLALRENLEHNGIVHRCVVIVSVDTQRVPHVPRDERLAIDDLGYQDDGITHITARFGFQDSPNVPEVLRMASQDGLEMDVNVDDASYFLSHITIVRGSDPGMARWRKNLFIGMAHTAASPVDYFELPDDRIVTMGAHIEL